MRCVLTENAWCHSQWTLLSVVNAGSSMAVDTKNKISSTGYLMAILQQTEHSKICDVSHTVCAFIHHWTTQHPDLKKIYVYIQRKLVFVKWLLSEFV